MVRALAKENPYMAPASLQSRPVGLGARACKERCVQHAPDTGQVVGKAVVRPYASGRRGLELGPLLFEQPELLSEHVAASLVGGFSALRCGPVHAARVAGLRAGHVVLRG